MGLVEEMLKQSRKPAGRFGAFYAGLMNIGHRDITRWGLNYIPINKDDTILDIGCGGGKTVNITAKIATEGKVYGIDYSEVSVAVASNTNKKLIDAGRVEIVHAYAESLPFADEMFNLITAIESCYFWSDLVTTLKEIRRVLKPGGSVILINACYRDERFEKRNSDLARKGEFTYHLPDEFRTFLKEAGYSPIQIEVLENKNWIAALGINGKT
jgi:ubiquinone/menaquinone biosynthesis C-methylase UbiE